MARYAVIENNVVVNCIEADESFISKAIEDGLFMEAVLLDNSSIDIGDQRQEDGTFIHPESQE